MSNRYYNILTNKGKDIIANNAIIGDLLEFKTLVIGDGGGRYRKPNETQTRLVNQVYSTNIDSVTVDENNSQHVKVSVVVGGGDYTIREIGILNKSDELVIVGSYPETYKPSRMSGSSKDLIVNIVIQVSNTKNIKLIIDPTVIIATQSDIEEKLERSHDEDIKEAELLDGREPNFYSTTSETGVSIRNHSRSGSSHSDIRDDINDKNDSVDEKLTTHNLNEESHPGIRASIETKASKVDVNNSIDTHNHNENTHTSLIDYGTQKVSSHNSDNTAHPSKRSSISAMNSLDVALRSFESGLDINVTLPNNAQLFNGKTSEYYLNINQFNNHINDTGYEHADILNEIDNLYIDSDRLTNNKTVTGSINELKRSVGTNKSDIAKMVSDKGVSTSSSDSFDTISNNIGKIKRKVIGSVYGSGNWAFPILSDMDIDKIFLYTDEDAGGEPFKMVLFCDYKKSPNIVYCFIKDRNNNPVFERGGTIERSGAHLDIRVPQLSRYTNVNYIITE